MSWLLVDGTTHQIVSGPHAAEPSAEDAYAVIVALGWPGSVAWSPAVVDFRELANLAEYIDLTDSDVVTGTQYLETLALIAEGRAGQVLAGQAPA